MNLQLNFKSIFQERRKEAERMAREREEFRRQQEQLRYEQEKRNNLKRGREYEHGYVGCFNFVFQQFQGSVLMTKIDSS